MRAAHVPTRSASMVLTARPPNARPFPALSTRGFRPIMVRTPARDEVAAARTALPVRAPELAWRAPPARSPQDPDFARILMHPPRAGSSEPSASTAIAARPVVPSIAPAAPPVRATSLDPALVDRLADDVIRRVERRARIERERRGL